MIEWIDGPSTQQQPVGVGLIDPVGQVWNTETYKKCIGPKFQDCSTKYSGKQLEDCLDMMQKECIALALDEIQKTQPVSGYPWLVETEDTRKLQEKINVELGKLGYQAIDTDGKLGSETCGALRFLYQETGGEWMTLYGGNCQSYTDPVKIGETPPPPQPPLPPPPAPVPTCAEGEQLDPTTNKCIPIPTPPAPTTPTKKGGINWGLALLAGAVVLTIGFAVKSAGGSGAAGAAA